MDKWPLEPHDLTCITLFCRRCMGWADEQRIGFIEDGKERAVLIIKGRCDQLIVPFFHMTTQIPFTLTVL